MTRKLFLVVTTCCLVATLTAFNNKQDNFPTAKSILQNMAKVNDDLYVCKYEVSNLEYRTFLDQMRTKNPMLAEDYKIDSMKWTEGINYGEPMAKYYHMHPAYSNYPVVNIRLEGAKAYCEWLTDQYNSDPKRKFKKVRFYIPTEEEWMNVANAGNKNKMYPWAGYYLRRKDGQFLCNFRHVGDEHISYDAEKKEYTISPEAKIAGSLSDRGVFTAAVNSFDAVLPYGIHNMSGNVAEMVNEKGIAKGGSFNSPGFDVRIESKMNYTNASPEIGFRVFMYIDNIEPGELVKPKKGEESNSKKTY